MREKHTEYSPFSFYKLSARWVCVHEFPVGKLPPPGCNAAAAPFDQQEGAVPTNSKAGSKQSFVVCLQISTSIIQFDIYPALPLKQGRILYLQYRRLINMKLKIMKVHKTRMKLSQRISYCLITYSRYSTENRSILSGLVLSCFLYKST